MHVETMCWNELPNLKTCPAKTTALAADPKTGEILSPHLLPQVNIKILSLKGWKMPSLSVPEGVKGQAKLR